MSLFYSAIGVLQPLVIALGAGLAIWGGIMNNPVGHVRQCEPPCRTNRLAGRNNAAGMKYMLLRVVMILPPLKHGNRLICRDLTVLREEGISVRRHNTPVISVAEIKNGERRPPGKMNRRLHTQHPRAVQDKHIRKYPAFQVLRKQT